MKSVFNNSHVVSGLLILAVGGLLGGCDEAPDQGVERGLGTVPGEPKVQVRGPAFPPADESSSTAEKPGDTGITQSESAAKPPAAPQSASDPQRPTTTDLKQALLDRGWREARGEDGSVLLLPPVRVP